MRVPSDTASDDAARAIADAIADGFEAIIFKLTARIVALEEDVTELDGICTALSNRIESVARSKEDRAVPYK